MGTFFFLKDSYLIKNQEISENFTEIFFLTEISFLQLVLFLN